MENIFSFVEILDVLYKNCASSRWIEHPLFNLWKYSLHCTHKHSSFVYYRSSGPISEISNWVICFAILMHDPISFSWTHCFFLLIQIRFSHSILLVGINDYTLTNLNLNFYYLFTIHEIKLNRRIAHEFVVFVFFVV